MSGVGGEPATCFAVGLVLRTPEASGTVCTLAPAAGWDTARPSLGNSTCPGRDGADLLVHPPLPRQRAEQAALVAHRLGVAQEQIAPVTQGVMEQLEHPLLGAGLQIDH